MVLIFCLAVFFSSSAGIISIKLLEILVLLLSISFLFKCFKQDKIVLKRTSFDLSIFILFVFVTFNYFVIHPSYYFAREQWLEIIFAVFLYYLIVNSINEESEIDNFINVFLIIALLEALFALWKRYYFTEDRLTGTLASPNFLMGFLLPLLLLAGERAQSHIKSENKYFKFGFIIVLFIAVFLCLVFSKSRSGLILFITLIFIWNYEKKSFRKWLFLIPAVLFLFVLLSPNFKRFLVIKGSDPLSYYRLSIWKSTLLMIKENLWSGVGLGNFKNSYLNFRLPAKGCISQYGRFAQFSHNEFLQLGAEIGIIGLIIGLIFISEYVWSFRKKRYNYLTFGLFKASTLIILQSFFDYNLHHPAIITLFVFLLASQEGLSNKEEKVFVLNPVFYLVIGSFMLVFIYFLICPVLSFYESKTGINKARNKENLSAIQHLQKAIKWTPDISSLYSYLADVTLLDYRNKPDQEKLKRAEKYFKNAISLEKDNPDFYIKLGFFYFDYYPPSSINLVREAFNKSFAVDQYNAFYRFYLGKIYLFNLKYKEAEEYFLQSINLEPNFLAPRIYLTYMYKNQMRESELRQARKEISQIEKLLSQAATDFEKQLVGWSLEDDWSLNRFDKKLKNEKNEPR